MLWIVLLQSEMNSWQSNSSLADLTARAEIIHKIRNFFVTKDILEVETPVLSSTTNPDPNTGSFQVSASSKLYLQTSPEFYMKRLLASHSNDIFQICKAFRQDESSKNHQREFTMLEWYRVGMSYHQLMDEVYELVSLFIDHPMVKIEYRELFIKYIGVDPFIATKAECEEIANRYNLNINDPDSLAVDLWLDLFLSQLIEPKLPKGIVFVYDYKPSQASLAKIRAGKVAERFELYIDGIEIANGFSELTDPDEQLIRFNQDNLIRKQRKLEQVGIDSGFISSLNYLPECSGVALGIDRLVKICLKKQEIQQIMSFAS